MPEFVCRLQPVQPILEDNFDSVNTCDRVKHWVSRSISRLWLTLVE
ncbi:hypothetical protein [Nostoc sp. DSM 114160]